MPEPLRVGYLPQSAALTAPSDRRRFVHYARARQIAFELADPRERYDLVVLNQRADLSVWANYRPGDSRIIYEANDSYILVPASETKQALRGVFKFFSGQSRRLQLNYREAVADMCRRSDAVVCSTDEQRALIEPLCGNVHLILDFQDADVMARKSDYAARAEFHVVWEGLASSGIPMRQMRDILEPLARLRPVVLHLVTDPVYYRYSNMFGRVDTAEQARRALATVAQVHLHPWSAQTLSDVATAADLALIPIDMRNTFDRGKPENKLLLLWRMGVPTLASATPAYRRAMQCAGLDMACESQADWHAKLLRYAADEAARARAGELGLQVANGSYSSDEMLLRWDKVLESLFDAESLSATTGKPITRDSRKP
jgi:hypothetical protein